MSYTRESSTSDLRISFSEELQYLVVTIKDVKILTRLSTSVGVEFTYVAPLHCIST